MLTLAKFLAKVLHFSFICVDGSDFVFVPHNITFPAGSSTSTFSITIQDDILFEMSEVFNVTLLTFPSSRSISIVDGITMIVIEDNDRKFLLRLSNSSSHLCHKIFNKGSCDDMGSEKLRRQKLIDWIVPTYALLLE